MIGAVFALSVLAGLALDYLSETPERTDRDGRRLQRMLAQWWTFSLFVLGAAFVAACLADGGRVGRLVLEKYLQSRVAPVRIEVHRIPWTTLGRDAAKLTLLALVAPVLVLLWSSRSRLRTAAGWLLVGLAYADLFVTGLDARSVGKRGPAGPSRDGHLGAAANSASRASSRSGRPADNSRTARRTRTSSAGRARGWS